MQGSSTTAEYMALFRALETARGDRLFQDDLARRFLSPRFRWLASAASLPGVARAFSWCIDLGWPGTRSSAVVRTRLIDDAVVAAIDSGIDQLVLLGAGLDSRGFRLPRAGRTRVFEVDHPDTQASKRARLAVLGAVKAVRFVPIDLAATGLERSLVDAGFAPTERSAVVWEGVTNYLTASAVDGTLEALGHLMCDGSLLVVTYVLPGLVDGAAGSKEAMRWARRVQKVGERFTFGSEPEAMARRLSKHGFAVLSDESTAEASLRLAAAGARAEPGSSLYRVVVARSQCPA